MRGRGHERVWLVRKIVTYTVHDNHAQSRSRTRLDLAKQHCRTITFTNRGDSNLGSTLGRVQMMKEAFRSRAKLDGD